MRRRLLIGVMIAMSGLAARAEEAVTLKDAPGRDIVEGLLRRLSLARLSKDQCGFLNRKGWESEVDKMIKAYGAPIGAANAKTIVDYLARELRQRRIKPASKQSNER